MPGQTYKGHGITADTPQNIALGAGTLHKGLKFTTDSWNLDESIFAATSGGNKLSITPEITPIEVDGANVAVMGLDYKSNETATLEVNIVEMTTDVFVSALNGEKKSTTTATGYDEIVPKDTISAGDYIENFGFVGQTLQGEPIIVIFDYAICTSGIEWDAKAKEAGVLAATFECRAPITGSLKSQAWHVYRPTVAAKMLNTQVAKSASK